MPLQSSSVLRAFLSCSSGGVAESCQVFAWIYWGSHFSFHMGEAVLPYAQHPWGASWGTRNQHGCGHRGGSVCTVLYPFFLAKSMSEGAAECKDLRRRDKMSGGCGNVENSGGYLRRWSVGGCVRYRRDRRHLRALMILPWSAASLAPSCGSPYGWSPQVLAPLVALMSPPVGLL